VATILLINGPNLDLLGQREPETYGVTTLAELEAQCTDLAAELGVTLECFQSNAEHAIVDRIHEAARNRVNCIVINPAAFTHTSVAIRDALLAVSIPFIELHLSNTHARESFRHHSYFSDIAQGVIAGLGPGGYDLAVRAAARIADSDKKSR
jgi:3-dehydroquinate dehydratase-2